MKRPGQGHHVDDHHLLEAEAVGELGDAVADDHQADLPVDRAEGERDRGNRQHRGDRHRGALGELAGSQRPEALLRVLAVELDVDQVVDEVAGAGDQAEGDEGERRLQHIVGLVELAREQQPGEDEDVLDPLGRPPRLDRRPQRRATRHDGLDGRSVSPSRDGRVFRGDGFHVRGGGHTRPAWTELSVATGYRRRAPALSALTAGAGGRPRDRDDPRPAAYGSDQDRVRTSQGLRRGRSGRRG